MKGKDLLEVLGGPLASSDSNAFIKAQYLRKKKIFFLRDYQLYKEWEPFWMRVEGQPIVDENGELIKWVAMQTNITKQKMAEEAIIVNEKKYRSIFESSPLSNFIYDPQTLQILEANQTAMVNYGYTLGEFRHLTINDLRAEKEPAGLQLDLINNGTFHGTREHKKKNGEIIVADVTTSHIEYRNNNAVLLIVKDITEKTKLLEDLIKEKARQREKFPGSHPAWAGNGKGGNRQRTS